MKYMSVGYVDKKKSQVMCESEQAYPDECFAYDDQLRKSGHPGEDTEPLDGVRNPVTMRWKNARFSITDGPCAETKEQFGRIRRVRDG
jgi:hypothetical protein